jgi:cathepsin L
LDVKRETSSLDFSARTIADPPSSVDWRTKGVVPPVKNQGQCGDVVPFQVTAAVDSFHAIQTGDLLELASVEEYIDCCTDGSCEGSLYGKESYTCIVRIGGLALESVYVAPEHKCLNNTFPGVIKIDGGEFVSPSGDETALEYAVAMQPVVAAIDASHLSFQFYKSGVYYGADCSDKDLDQLLLIVGYGTTDDGEEYWICQNSWGTSWGMQGYVYMARNRGNNCGIATMASYPV